MTQKKISYLTLAAIALGVQAFAAPATKEAAPQNHTTMRGGVDLLYWTARQDGLEYAIVEKADKPTASTGFANGKIHEIGAKWKPGVRVGLGYRGDHQSWSSDILWTHFSTEHSSRVSGGSSLLGTPMTADKFAGTDATSAFGHNELSTHLLDLEMGKMFRMDTESTGFAFRPHFGFRYAHINQKVRVKYERAAGTDVIHHGHDYNAFGMRAGLSSQWGLSDDFSIYANTAASLLASWYEISYKESLTNNANPLNLHQDKSSTKFNLEVELGVKWNKSFQDGAKKVIVNLGWAHHLFANHSQFLRANNASVNGAHTHAQGDLAFKGIVLGAKFLF